MVQHRAGDSCNWKRLVRYVDSKTCSEPDAFRSDVCVLQAIVGVKVCKNRPKGEERGKCCPVGRERGLEHLSLHSKWIADHQLLSKLRGKGRKGQEKARDEKQMEIEGKKSDVLRIASLPVPVLCVLII